MLQLQLVSVQWFLKWVKQWENMSHVKDSPFSSVHSDASSNSGNVGNNPTFWRHMTSSDILVDWN